MTTIELKNRTKKFAIEVLNLIDELSKNASSQVIRYQLAKAGTSVGANYRSACRAKSKADFIAKIGIVEEEADECCYWLEIMTEAGILDNERAKHLLKEANELTAIFAATGKTSKQNHSKFKK